MGILGNLKLPLELSFRGPSYICSLYGGILSQFPENHANSYTGMDTDSLGLAPQRTKLRTFSVVSRLYDRSPHWQQTSEGTPSTSTYRPSILKVSSTSSTRLWLELQTGQVNITASLLRNLPIGPGLVHRALLSEVLVYRTRTPIDVAAVL